MLYSRLGNQFSLKLLLLASISFQHGYSLGLFRSINTDGVKFYYIPTTGVRREIKYNDFESVATSELKDGASTIILIDGFGSNSTTPFLQIVSDAFLSQRKNRNVIIVDYESLSGSSTVNFNSSGRLTVPFIYLRTLGNVDAVGLRVADFLNFLNKSGKVTFSDVHVVGMSLGAHIAGTAGNYVQSQYGGKIGRITGLDPAPTFSLLRRPRTISRGAGTFVDVYHTNRGTLGESRENTGDTNVYVNGGSTQPGCETLDRTRFPGYCSHSYAWKMYGASVSKNLLACPCSGSQCFCMSNCNSNCATPSIVGIYAANTLRGSYRLDYKEPL